MSQPARKWMSDFATVSDLEDPVIRARLMDIAEAFLKNHSELLQEILERGRDRVRDEGRLTEARSALRRVLSRRSIALGPDDEARIDACTDLATLERWLDEAAVATNVADVFRPAAG